MINFHFNRLSDLTHLIAAQTLEKKWGRAWENKGGEDSSRTAALTAAHSYIGLSLSINHRVRYSAVIILHVSINCSFPTWEKRGWRSQINTIHFDWQLVVLNFPLSSCFIWSFWIMLLSCHLSMWSVIWFWFRPLLRVSYAG